MKHMIEKSLRLPAICVVLITCVGCQTLDFELTGIRRVKSTKKHDIFEYTAFASPSYPLDSDEAEQTRMEWLERHLRFISRKYGYSTDNYEILSRKVVKTGEGLLSDTHNIFYKVRVPNRALKKIREELEDEIHSRGWTFWHLEETAEITDDGYTVTLTRNPGAPNEIEVSQEFPEDAPPGTVARRLCDAMAEKVD